MEADITLTWWYMLPSKLNQFFPLLFFSKESQSEVAETSENACFMRCTRESMNVMEEETEETCNGEVFLNCILGSSQKSDIDDLADFIVCKRAKDYSSWWKDRERYRGMKIQRKKQLRWEKRKNAWKSMVGKKHR